jgi:hypothetical protein
LLGGLAVIALHSPLANSSGPPERYTLPKIDVKVVNTPNVIVKNSASSPVPVQIVSGGSVSQEYFFFTGEVAFVNGGGIQAFTTVPAGRRYLIEQISVFCNTLPATLFAGVGLAVRPAGAAQYQSHFIVPPPMVPALSGRGYLSTGTQIRMEAPAGAEIGGQVNPANANVSSNCTFNISGHSVPET